MSRPRGSRVPEKGFTSLPLSVWASLNGLLHPSPLAVSSQYEFMVMADLIKKGHEKATEKVRA